MEMKQTVLVTKVADPHPRGDDDQLDPTKPPHTFRFLQAAPDHIDYDDAQRLWAAGMPAQVQATYPVNGSQWGETHPRPTPKPPGRRWWERTGSWPELNQW